MNDRSTIDEAPEAPASLTAHPNGPMPDAGTGECNKKNKYFGLLRNYLP